MSDSKPNKSEKKPEVSKAKTVPSTARSEAEVGGREGPEPTRYGDWEKNGLISDF